MDASQKWACPRCTYSNWPKSRKCTVCSFVRELPQLEDDLSCTYISVSKEPFPPQERCNSDWSCTACTFLNKPASPECTQCGNMQSYLSLPINTANEKNMCQVLTKWICERCTYENWPKSKSCVMCRLIKSASNTPLINEKKSEPSASSNKMSCQSFSETVDQPTDGNFLNACKAILLGYTAPIEVYLRSGQSPNRQITIEESKMLENWFSNELPLRTESLPATNEISQTEVELFESSNCPKVNSLLCPFQSGRTLLEIALMSQRSDLSCLFVRKNPPSPQISLDETSVDQQQIDLNRNFHSQPTSELSQLGCSPCQLSELRRRFFSKRSPCQSSPYIAKELRRILLASLRQRKGDFQCNYVSVEMGTFALPAAVRDLSPLVRNLLFAELLDTEAQTELEHRSGAINWWVTGDQQSTSRLFALWNRTDGNCLLDSLLQASWGVFDKQKTLRHALSESMLACESAFFRIWREHEQFQAADQYRLNDSQILRDWEISIQAAIQPNSSLEQIHIFILCHILRRPVIVYSVKLIKNFRDEPIGISNFQGIYLPLLWERSFCSRNPLILGYTRGHFNALVPMVPSYFSSVSPQLKSDATYSDTEASLDITELTHSGATPFKVSKDLNEEDKSQSCSHSVMSPGASVSNTSDCERKAEIIDSSWNSAIPARTTLSSGQSNNSSCTLYLPLFDKHFQPLPLHFSSATDPNSVTALLRDRLDVIPTKRGFFLACLRLTPQNNLVGNLINDWLSIYRNISDFDTSVPTAATGGSAGGGYC